MSKNNPNLTVEQKLILFEEGTERPGSSELNSEKRKGSYYCANCGVNMKVGQDGRHFINLYLMSLKQKLITI